MSFNGSTLYLYKNGVLSATAISGTMQAPGVAFMIGTNYAAVPTEQWGGSIDQVRYYNYARTQAQIAYGYNRGGPVGWWKMDECQGNTINDASGNGNNGTLIIGAGGTQSALGTCTTATTAWGNGVIGKFGSSISFDGTDDDASVPNNGIFNRVDGQELSVSTWINPARLAGQYQDIVTTRDVSVGHNWILYQHVTDGSVQLHGAAQNKSTYIPPINQWTHIVATVNAAGLYRLYANGVLVQGPIAFNFAAASPAVLFIGREPSGSEHYQGKLDDVQIFNYALTDKQISVLFNQGSTLRFGQ